MLKKRFTVLERVKLHHEGDKVVFTMVYALLHITCIENEDEDDVYLPPGKTEDIDAVVIVEARISKR